MRRFGLLWDLVSSNIGDQADYVPKSFTFHPKSPDEAFLAIVECDFRIEITDVEENRVAAWHCILRDGHILSPVYDGFQL